MIIWECDNVILDGEYSHPPPLWAPHAPIMASIYYTHHSQKAIFQSKHNQQMKMLRFRKSSDTINSDSGWRVDEEKGGMTWRNKNGGETEQKGPLFPSRTFSPWPHRWWWWWRCFCSNNRNTIKIKTEINLMIGGNAIKSKRASETNVCEDPFQWYLWSHGSKLNTN